MPYYLRTSDGLKETGEYRDASDNLRFLVKCPECRSQHIIDNDQNYGRVAVKCGCGYHGKMHAPV